MPSAFNRLEWGLGSQPETEAGSWWQKHQTLATRSLVSDKKPGPLAFQKRISTKMESSEASKVFIRRKKSIIQVDRHMGKLKKQVPESPPHGHFFWPIILICLVHSSYSVYLKIVPCVRTHLSAKMEPTTKANG